MARSQFTVNELLKINGVADAQISPNGQRIAYTVSENGSEKGQRQSKSRICSVPFDGGRSTQISAGPDTDHTPRWSPNGDRLAFLSDRQKRGKFQLYVLGSLFQEAHPLTDLEAGVDEFSWSPDGSGLAITSSDHVPETDNDVKLFDEERCFKRLYLVDAHSGETTSVEHGDIQVWEFCWSPDGRQIAAIVSDEPQSWAWYSSRLASINVESGEVKTLHQPERQIARPAWSPDGKTVALITCRWSDPGMSGGDVLLVDANTGVVRNLTEGEPRSHLLAHWLPDGNGLLTIGWEHARAQFCRIDLQAGSQPLWQDDQGITDFSFSYSPRSGRLAAVLSSLAVPHEVWAGEYDTNHGSIPLRRVTSREPVVPGFSGVEPLWQTWTSVDGREIHGLYLGPGPKAESEPPPMVTLVHGGPTGVATNSFPLIGPSAWITFLVQRGYAVFLPNYRGSNGYGPAFAEANVGDLGGLDLQDVLSGIDECVRRELADPERLGIGGWSYGGYLTSWAITRTSRFKAAVAGASITNWYSFHGGTNIPGFDSQFIGAPPHELDGPYAWTSPLFFCDRVSTPTLFLHGEQDPVCPVGQAYEMTRSLRRCGIKAECAVYPREGHGLSEREHRRDMIERAVRWFETHLGPA
jgi:dipeptidyl aminopeptidase/acylaminoacyl peptidase